MEKRFISFVILMSIVLLFFSMPVVSAQTYSGINRFTDNVKLFFSNGDNKVKLALEIREKEVNSALENAENGNTENAVKNLENAQNKLEIVQEKVSLETSKEVKNNTEEIINKVNEDKSLPKYFDEYVLEEEKTQLTAVLTEKTYEYCSELAKEDFALMLKDEECNPETAPESLKKDLEKLKDLQERMFIKLMLEIRSCMDDPGTCNCENNVDEEQKIKCEKMVALALKCEYKDDEGACNELNSLEAPKAESFVPKFLMNLFRAKEEQMLWGESHSDCVPEECWNKNDKPECKQYDKFKETEEDWDEYGNFIGTRNKCGKEGSTPTMRESIPQCFEGDVFLEEKCGKITMVENEEGLINYIIGKEVENTIDEFENKSRGYALGTSANGTIDINGTAQHPMEIRKGWMIVDNEWVVDEGAQGIKREMNQIKEQIAERTFAPGTYDAGNFTNDIKNVVVEGSNGSGDGGLKPEVKTDVAGGGSGGESGVVIEGGKNNVVTGGHDKNDPLITEPNLNKINSDLYNPNARAPEDTIIDPDGEPTNTIDP